MAADIDRFRSFAERYVIARAPEFDKSTEQADAWEALLNARTIYEQIADMSRRHVDHPTSNTAPVLPDGQGQKYGGPVFVPRPAVVPAASLKSRVRQLFAGGV